MKTDILLQYELKYRRYAEKEKRAGKAVATWGITELALWLILLITHGIIYPKDSLFLIVGIIFCTGALAVFILFMISLIQLLVWGNLREGYSGYTSRVSSDASGV